jgi:fibrillarin-like rRNA methylase
VFSVIELHRIINPSKIKINLNNILRFGAHRAVNTPCLVYKSNYLMLCKKIIALFSEISTRHVTKICGQNVEYFNIKRGVT